MVLVVEFVEAENVVYIQAAVGAVEMPTVNGFFLEAEDGEFAEVDYFGQSANDVIFPVLFELDDDDFFEEFVGSFEEYLVSWGHPTLLLGFLGKSDFGILNMLADWWEFGKLSW